MKRPVTLLLTLMLVFTLAACSANTVETATTASTTQTTDAIVSETTTQSTTGATPTQSQVKTGDTHEEEADYTWESSAEILIQLNGSEIITSGAGVTVDGSKATITTAGTYKISGTLSDGQIIVDTQDEAVVRLILSGVDLRSSISAPVYIRNAEKTVIVLADNTHNLVTDGSSYMLENVDEDEPNAAIFSKSGLTLYGAGALTVNGNYNDGIASKDGLIIAGGTIEVTVVDDGIRGKDYVVVKNGNITINSQGDGIKSDNEEDASQGFIAIEDGVFNITTTGDALTAQSDVSITDGDFTLVTSGGNDPAGETISAKGIKSVANVTIAGGAFTINAVDDALHTNGNLTLHNGVFNITSGDDGIHADAALTINNGEINITESYEGLESAVITINSGNIHVSASDDGINVAGGNDGSGMMQGMRPGPSGGRPAGGPGGGPGTGIAPDAAGAVAPPDGSQQPGGFSGQDAFSASGSYYLYINGGYIVVDANGDGIDVNGAIEMTGGTVIVNGPTQQMNGALDYDAGFNMTGGFLVAAGSTGMAQAPGDTSSQYSVLINFDSSLQAGDLVHIQDSTGKNILTFAPTKLYQSIAFTAPELTNGETYTVSIGGSSTGTATDGLYQNGTYTPGSEYTRFTIADVVTKIGDTGRNRP